MTAYYNEIEPFAADWLEELIKEGHIAPGVVDRRSIEDVTHNELKEFTQCHFFAGIGVWSYALRQAGWPDDRPVWTASCPCQPFSTAGKGAGFADERHLWPSFYHLASQRKPITVFGEQSSSKGGLAWLDLVQTDMEDAGYALGSTDICSAGFGSPNIRQRTYFVAERLADVCGEGLQERISLEGFQPEAMGPHPGQAPVSCGNFSGLANSPCERRDGGEDHPKATGWDGSQTDSTTSGLGNSYCEHAGRNAGASIEKEGMDKGGQFCDCSSTSSSGDGPGPTNGFWRDADWLLCRDGKLRPVEPSTFPLATGVANRVGKLRGYGNAINAQVAKAFIMSAMECIK